MSMGGKGGSSPSGTTTTNVQPWSGQQPYLTSGFQSAQNLYNTGGPQYDPNSTHASMNDWQNSGLSTLAGIGSGDTLPDQAAQANNNFLSGYYLNMNPSFGALGGVSTDNYGAEPHNTGSADLSNYTSTTSGPLAFWNSGQALSTNNPYTNAAVDSITTAVQPAIESQFINGGTLSSPEAARATAAGVASAVAPYTFGQYQNEEKNTLGAAGLGEQAASTLSGNILSGAGLQTTAANDYGNQWEAGLNDIMRGVALSPTTDSTLYNPATQEYNAGTAYQNQAQGNINDAVQRWNYGQTEPYDALNAYLSQVGGTGYGSSTTTPFFNNSSSNILGGALGGASLGNMLFPAAAGATSYGALGGAGLGSLFGLLSDRRAKADIMPVGELDNGLTVYSYRYKGEPEGMRHIGLMADEVEQDHPEAVTELPGFFGNLAGLKTVDYAKAVT